MKPLFYIVFLFATVMPMSAFEDSETKTGCDTTTVFYKVNRSRLDTAFRDNNVTLRNITGKIESMKASKDTTLVRIEVQGSASPEGPLGNNRRLSENRAKAVENYLKSNFNITDSLFAIKAEYNSWRIVQDFALRDAYVSANSQAMAMIAILADTTQTKNSQNRAFHSLSSLEGGKLFQYIFNNLYPQARATIVRLIYEYTPAYLRKPLAKVDLPQTTNLILAPETMTAPTQTLLSLIPNRSPFYMSLRTNMLYDAGLVPNIGADFYLGKNWSVSGFWTYSWWKSDGPHWYWRTYGGDIAIRKWFGSAAKEKPLTGHHIGLYFQALTYDFEWGGRGYMAGIPGGTMWDKCNLGGGIEYGYSLPIKRRLNLDFTIAVGYLAGECQEYIPDDGCYVWQKTVDRKWFGPTKAEVSLVWLIGNGNYNKKKGGKK